MPSDPNEKAIAANADDGQMVRNSRRPNPGGALPGRQEERLGQESAAGPRGAVPREEWRMMRGMHKAC